MVLSFLGRFVQHRLNMRWHMISCAVALLAVAAVCAVAAGTTRPIIGILTQPTGSSLAPLGSSYIAASYVKWIESAGARVVPIPHNADTDTLDALLSSINGVVFPGGGADIDNTPIWFTAQYIVAKVIAMNKAGTVFPLHGTCMGFELLASVCANNPNVLSEFDAENISLPLDFTSAAQKSAMFGQAPQRAMDAFTNQPITMNNHMLGLDPATFNTTHGLFDVFTITSFNRDREGYQFVSTIEAPKYGLYGTQWHPEKAAFEWNPDEGIVHTADSVFANNYIAQFFVGLARQNSHAFADAADETAALIYNWDSVFTGKLVADFQQCYFFDW
jgi:gamma-glutamyl hydrolase